jgi:hypothetical protein
MSDVCLMVDEFAVREERFSRGPWPSQTGYAVQFIIATEESANAFKQRLLEMKENSEDDAVAITLKDPTGRQVIVERFHVNAMRGGMAEERDEENKEKIKKIVGELWGKKADVREPLNPGGLGMGW